MSTGNGPHDLIEELIVADALDGLDESDGSRLAEALRSHGPGCVECRRLLREYSEVAGALAVSVEPVALRSGAEDRLIAKARSVPAVAAPSSPAVMERGRPRTRWAAAVAIAAVVALISGVIGYTLAPRGASVPSEFLGFVAAPGTRIIRFPPLDGQHLAVAVRPGQRGAWIVGSGLAKPSGGRVYELWFQPAPAAKMRPAGIFTPAEGRVVSPVTVGESFVVLAVSIEPAGGSLQPTTTPVFVAKG
jgi:hypothetical protein